MKSILLMLSFYLLLGCKLDALKEVDKRTEYRLVVKNKSGYDITIEAYVSAGTKHDSIFIKNGDEYSKKVKYYHIETDGKLGIYHPPQNPTIFSDYAGGSRSVVIIKFGNKRFIKQTSDNIKEYDNSLLEYYPVGDKNLFQGIYNPRTNAFCYIRHVYCFTKKDFENATPL